MAIDVRATCTCSLGTLISAQISDDYIQGQGLVKCQGSVELSGLYTPAIGTAVTFTYTKGGITRTIPRKLRVMSSFADPYRRTTRVEVGCKLTYLSDKKDSIDWTAFDDPENTSYTQADARIVTVPIYAKSVAEHCMQELGINTASPLPLTNAFSIATFDFSPGYVQVLSDLLVSESYCAYLDANEVLQVFSLDQTGGSGPVLTSANIIDLGPIGVGQLPGEAVTVSYSSLKLVKPEITTDGDDGTPDEALWEYNEEVSPISTVIIPYRVQGQEPLLLWQSEGRTTTVTTTDYDNIDGRDVVVSQRTVVTGPVSVVVSNLIKQYIESGFLSFNDYYTTLSDETTTYEYDNQGNQTSATTTRSQNSIAFMGSLALKYVYDDGTWVSHGNVMYDAGYTKREFQNTGNFTRTIEHNYKMWVNTQEGQQAVAAIGESFTTAQDVIDFLPQARSIVYDGTSISSGLRVVAEGRPPIEDLTNQVNSQPASIGTAIDDRDPDNGWRTESRADLELALGSATAQRRIELSMPYAPDDVFSRSSSAGPGGAVTVTYTAQPSDVAAKAKRYGICQNRLLLGNRSGMNLQLAPELLPAAPFAPLMVDANGLSALYRVNASGWTLSAEGCIASTDSLFWGAVGGTGNFSDVWFPLAPTITALPAAPAVVDTTPTAVLGTVATVGSNPQTALTTAFPAATNGQAAYVSGTGDFWSYSSSTSQWVNVGPIPGPTLTTTTVVPVWNATVKLEAGPTIGAVLTSYPYTLQPMTTAIGPVGVQIGAVVRRLTIIRPPAAQVALTASAPSVATGASVAVPGAAVAMAALAPDVAGGASVPVPAAAVSVAAVVPELVGKPRTEVVIPAGGVEVMGLAPEVVTGAAVEVPAAGVTVAGVVPSVVKADPYFANVSLLLPMNGTNGSTTFTDASSNARTVSRFGNAQISTAQSKWGGASGYFDGVGDSLTLTGESLGTGDFTIECWIRATSPTSSFFIFDSREGDSSTTGLAFYVRSSTQKLALGTGNPIVVTEGTTTIAANTWYHVALTRSGTTVRGFVSGSQEFSISNSFNFTRTAWRIGHQYNAFGTFSAGHIDDLRITKAARYQSSFTPPTAPFPNS